MAHNTLTNRKDQFTMLLSLDFPSGIYEEPPGSCCDGKHQCGEKSEVPGPDPNDKFYPEQNVPQLTLAFERGRVKSQHIVPR